MATPQNWECFPHGADIGIRGYGNSVSSAFANAGVALMSVITNPHTIAPKMSVSIHCDASDLKLLFVDWINAIIYEMETRHLLFSEFNVDINENCLSAVIKGEPIDRTKHQPTVDIKGATYTELKVNQLANQQWVAQCVVDV